MKAQEFNISTIFHSILVEVFCCWVFFFCLCYHGEFCDGKTKGFESLVKASCYYVFSYLKSQSSKSKTVYLEKGCCKCYQGAF